MQQNKMEAIPINENKWIDYQDQILVIKPDEAGNYACWQSDGTMCRQRATIGLVVSKFKSKSKWFNDDWWYTKTSWGDDYPNKVYFNDIPEESLNYDDMDAWIDFSTKIANKKGRPAENILKAIFKEVNKKTGMDLKFSSEITEYGCVWDEAFVPAVDKKGNHYVITWMNCD